MVFSHPDDADTEIHHETQSQCGDSHTRSADIQDTLNPDSVCAAAATTDVMFFKLNSVEKYTSGLFPVPSVDEVSVVNLSDFHRSDACMSLLKCGLKFC